MAGAPTYLDRILDAHRTAAASRNADLGQLREAAAGAPPGRGFAAALAAAASGGSAAGGPAVIAEIKRRSPSKGVLAGDLDPATVAAEYAAGGAAALSVLTDAEFFGGSVADLQAARAAVDLPVLRKDFTVCEADVYETRAMGADAMLLIVAALDDDELALLHATGLAAGLDVLVEVHDEGELERAVDCGATLIGVNQRDLITFAVDTERAERVAAAMPIGVLAVAESGIDGPASAARLAAAGFTAVLVGETLVRAPDRAAAVRGLRGARVGVA
ncbi:MAG: indole-3-glycerol phosphate synthase TrpC [Acidimicrobiales bacterium]